MRSHDVARSWAQSSRTHVVSVDCVEFHKGGMMPSTIQYGVRDGRLVTLSDVQRGETALMCYTCGDRIVVKDGGGQFVDGKGRRNRGRGKHFSHTSNSRCHGEGPAHYQLKVALSASINRALAMRPYERNMHGYIQYLCPDEEYGPHDGFKHAPGKDEMNRPFPAMERGYHQFDLLANLDRAEREVFLDGGRTRADVAGLDPEGRVLWAIEIKRNGSACHCLSLTSATCPNPQRMTPLRR